jgi:hypothetical protein
LLEEYPEPENTEAADLNIGISAVSWLLLFQLVLWKIAAWRNLDWLVMKTKKRGVPNLCCGR